LCLLFDTKKFCILLTQCFCGLSMNDWAS
jgi:hypothetical protein